MRIIYFQGPKDIRRIYGQNLHVTNHTDHIRRLTETAWYHYFNPASASPPGGI